MFLTLRRGKMRGKRPSQLDFFAQPFDIDERGDQNEMRLQEDTLLPGKKCYGVREIGDGLAKAYDPNAQNDENAGALGGSSREDRTTARSGAVLKGGGSRGGRHAPPKKLNQSPDEPITVTVEYEDMEDGEAEIARLGLEGL